MGAGSEKQSRECLSGQYSSHGEPRQDDWDAERQHVAAIRGADWWVQWAASAERDSMRSVVARGALRLD
jgi:hypothetical protein